MIAEAAAEEGDADRAGPERLAGRRDRPGRVQRRRRAGVGRARERVILVRRETTPDDYHGMIASQGILTSAGGTNSHAAVVARGEGIPAVCGADAIKLDRAGEDVHGERRHRRRGRRHHDRRLHRQGVRRRAAAGGVDAGEGARRATTRPATREDLAGVRAADGAAPTRSAACAFARTPTRPTRRRTRATAAPRASACAAPSTCSWARSA